jgi:hypothetical protein
MERRDYWLRENMCPRFWKHPRVKLFTIYFTISVGLLLMLIFVANAFILSFKYFITLFDMITHFKWEQVILICYLNYMCILFYTLHLSNFLCLFRYKRTIEDSKRERLLSLYPSPSILRRNSRCISTLLSFLLIPNILLGLLMFYRTISMPENLYEILYLESEILMLYLTLHFSIFFMQ